MNIQWRIWTTATTEEKAQRVGRRALEALEQSGTTMAITPYEKTGGHLIEFVVRIPAESWADGVLNALVLGERLGRSWILFGGIADELNAMSNDASLAGVTMLKCAASRLRP